MFDAALASACFENYPSSPSPRASTMSTVVDAFSTLGSIFVSALHDALNVVARPVVLGSFVQGGSFTGINLTSGIVATASFLLVFYVSATVCKCIFDSKILGRIAVLPWLVDTILQGVTIVSAPYYVTGYPACATGITLIAQFGMCRAIYIDRAVYRRYCVQVDVVEALLGAASLRRLAARVADSSTVVSVGLNAIAAIYVLVVVLDLFSGTFVMKMLEKIATFVVTHAVIPVANTARKLVRKGLVRSPKWSRAECRPLSRSVMISPCTLTWLSSLSLYY